MTKFLQSFLYVILFLFISTNSIAQKNNQPKYNSLLWEITGNGLTRPSYLFGTMHVSSKLAFHLSDSFYYALKKVDAVALELNPELWQDQMMELNQLNLNYSYYTLQPGNNYLTENTFKIKKFDDNLKQALSSEPPVVNNLLYRSYKAQDDFEEDTFLDLYIFQTGRKLGKAAAGLEDYVESEKLMIEAYTDMAKEKNKKEIDLDGETMYSMGEKIQQAYRKGDLDLMDSLDNILETSPAFNEKFLYKRNEIQANSIDTIIQKRSLFAGVGAAHLPGSRGVIELLREKGYTLRPIIMTDRDATQKAEVEKKKVPVKFQKYTAADKLFELEVPGKLYPIRNAYSLLNRWQYADMNNGSYYLITRIKTYNMFSGKTTLDNLLKVDSSLYENIPGRILSVDGITKNGYEGLDIKNRTRNGDLQRYQIFALPFELIIFKMSGTHDYVEGAEGTQFFESIKLKNAAAQPATFSPPYGGFTLNLPKERHIFYDKEGEGRWEYEAKDPATGDAYLIFKASLYNYFFLAEDSFDLTLMDAGFRAEDYFDTVISRRYEKIQGYPALLTTERLKTGEMLQVAHVINGPQQYVFAKKSADVKDTSFAFLANLKFTDFSTPPAKAFTDTFMKFQVQTPFIPDIDPAIRVLIEDAAENAVNGNNANNYIAYWPKEKYANFVNDTTGQFVSVQVTQYPRYYYIADSAKFWNNIIENISAKRGLFLARKEAFKLANGATGYHINLTDTGSSRMIKRMMLLQDKYLYTLTAVSDTLTPEQNYTNNFFKSFASKVSGKPFDMYANKLDVFFKDLFSTDSALHKFSQTAIANIYYGSAGSKKLYEALQKLSLNDKDYFDSKATLIAEYGYITDTVTHQMVDDLKAIYQQTADTFLFQNEVIKSLAKLRNEYAYKTLKNIIIQDPPIFQYAEDYTTIFNQFQDTLALSARFFPDLLKLTTLSDYKEPVTDLLVMLVDSGFLKAKDYKKYYPSIYIDAKVALKKQQSKDESSMQDERRKLEMTEEERAPEKVYDYYNNNRFGLNDYAVLLIPFYEKDKNVVEYFRKLLQSKDEDVKMNTAVLLLRNKKEVPDSIFYNLASQDKYRAFLYRKLKYINRLDRFPEVYKTQYLIAKSFLVAYSGYDKMDSLEYISKTNTSIKSEPGVAYFFRYRIKKTDEWKIALSGLQPLNEREISVDDDLVRFTDKNIKLYEPLQPQLELQLKKVIYDYYPSARYFFAQENGYNNYSDYED